LASVPFAVTVYAPFEIPNGFLVFIFSHAGIGNTQINRAGSAVVFNHHILLRMLGINICDLLVQLSQLHIIVVKFVVVHHLVYLLHPLVIHKHVVVPVGNRFLPSNKLLILRFHFESVSLDIVALFEEVLIGNRHRGEDVSE